MKVETIPYPREFGLGDSGIDVRAVKRALAHWQGSPDGMSLRTLTFGPRAQLVLRAFQGGHGVPIDGRYTLPTHTHLRAFFDPYGASLMARMTHSLAARRQRDAFTNAYRWSIAHRGQYRYAEVRPIPEHLVPYETMQIIETDCSGNTEISASWAPVPDPSQLGFDGQGNTGTLLHACTWVTAPRALWGDLIVYRAGGWDLYGHHVVVILERQGGDFLIGSHGHEGDPGEYMHSAMLASQASRGYPDAVFLRFLPTP